MRHRKDLSRIVGKSYFIRVSTVLLIGTMLTVLAAQSPSASIAQEATSQPTAESTAAMGHSTAEIAAAANTFLATLTDAQKTQVLFDFNDTAQRVNWSNFPTTVFPRAGIPLDAMTDEQRTDVMTLLQTVLSEQGYQQVIDTMTADEILRQTDTGGSANFGFGKYYISILGMPSETEPWILQWGGHHLALNITFAGSNVVFTPSHTGCQPCVYTINDKQVEVLGDEYSKALKLINALDGDNQATAILDYSVTNLVLGPGEEDRALEPEGLPASKMTADQQAMLLDVISEWVGIANDDAAAARMAEIKANIADTYFAWSGDISETSGAYFRITGPKLLIEFAPQGNGNNSQGGGGQGGGPNGGGGVPNQGGTTAQATAQTTITPYTLDLGTFTVIEETAPLYHVHTIYRDPTNAYGAAVTGQ